MSGRAASVSKADNPSGVFLFLLRPRPTYPGIVDPQPSLYPFYRVSPRVIVVVAARKDEIGGGERVVVPEGCEAAATCWRDNVLALLAAPHRRSSPASAPPPPPPLLPSLPPALPSLSSPDRASLPRFLPFFLVQLVAAGRGMRFSTRTMGWFLTLPFRTQSRARQN